MRQWLLAVAVALAACAALASPALGAPARNVNLLKTFKSELPRIKAKTSVPVLLPRVVPMVGTPARVYANEGAKPKSWVLTLAAAPNCGGATACFEASFEGIRGKPLPAKSNARLANDDSAWYRASTCGASCSPWSLSFVHRGVLYSWKIQHLPPKNTKAILLRLAAAAVSAGPR